MLIILWILSPDAPKKRILKASMLRKHTVRIGKLVKKASKLKGGNGSALPGLVVEKINPHFLRESLSALPYGVVLITGTNGKTTTTKIVTQLLRAHGLKVFTNPSGSNFTRGIASSILSHVNAEGKLDADIAVLELDEAYAVHFVRQVSPRYTLVLNIFRDQLDRFGEIDHTAKLLKQVVAATEKGVVLNRDDEIVQGLSADVSEDAKLHYFGVSDKLQRLFPSDADMRTGTAEQHTSATPPLRSSDTILDSMKQQTAVFAFGKKLQPAVSLKLAGVYNLQNAAAALTLTRMILGEKAAADTLLRELSNIRPAFGRGEAIEIDGKPLEIVLVKNPSGFRLSLRSYAKKPAATMIAINDLYADGRDMSWLWDVDFSIFSHTGVQCVSGARAYDMALRLQYDEVEVGSIIPDVATAIRTFMTENPGSKRIFCTYTAMLALRRELAKTEKLEPIE